MFGRIVKVIRLFQERKITAKLHQVYKEYGYQPFVSASVDLWSSKHSKQGYAAMDVQFGDPFIAAIQSFTLAVKYIPGRHGHESLVNFIKTVSTQYGFDDVKSWVLVGTIDGGSNVVLAMETLGIVIIYCYTHRLHLSVKRALGQYGAPSINELVARLMTRVRALIGHFTRSPTNMSELIRIQREAGGKGLRPLQDMVVRWLATANALKRLMLLRPHVKTFFDKNDHDFPNQLSPTGWKAVQGILAVLEFGRQVSTKLQTETQSVIAIGWLWVLLFIKHCRNVKRQPSFNDPNTMEATTHDSLHPRAKSVASALASDAAKRFCKNAVTSIERYGLMADPRTKNSPAIFGFTDDEIDATKEGFSKVMYNIASGRRGGAPEAPQEQRPDRQVNMDVDPLLAEMAALDEDTEPMEQEANDDDHPAIHPALTAYLDTTPSVPFGTQNFDPLQYHLNRRSKSEVHYLTCILFLCLALTSARNERTFSVAGHVLDELSVQLSPEMLESLIMIKRNWSLLLHTVKKTIQTTDAQGQSMFVEVEKEEVDWKPLLELYVEMYGKDPAKEAEKRRKPRQHEPAPPESEEEAFVASDGDEDEDEDEDQRQDDDQSAAADNDDDRQSRKRPRHATTRRKKRQEDMDQLQSSMPKASVCIDLGSCLWPEDTAEFTKGVEAVFLAEPGSEDDEDLIPLAVVFGDEGINADGEWGVEARKALRQYGENEQSLQDANGYSLDLKIEDPEQPIQQQPSPPNSE